MITQILNKENSISVLECSFNKMGVLPQNEVGAEGEELNENMQLILVGIMQSQA